MTKRYCRYAVLLIVLLSGACASPAADRPAPSAPSPTGLRTGTGTKAPPAPAPPPLPSSEPAAPAERRVTLAAAGDVLIHRTIYEDARTRLGYDFRPIFEAVRRDLEGADVTFANQESMTGGTGLGLSDYPAFNSPFEAADALRDAGVDIVSMANNHTLDRGEQAVRLAIRHWKRLGVEYAGASEDQADRKRLRIVERNGLKLAFVAWTYGTNGIPRPSGKPYLVHLLEQERAFQQEIAEAKKQADAVVASLHFGTEYARLPSEQQRKWARLAAAAGADVILGHHPHVLQPPEWIDNGSGGRTLVAYSLGNFLAAQKKPHPYVRIGGILKAELRKPSGAAGSKAAVMIGGVRFLPTYVRFQNWRGYRVIPLSQASGAELPGVRGIREEIASHMRRWVPDLLVD
ncbi:CapA family protein [Paenibacillus ehimensis]|uniref:CapA family protein n=1 Tax=Paenibacillus ehimensis TaxID=79264 RepID=A0ABT8V1T7_9BACL|nr:CapA family protein [Paenibacillus ehimensis]MDO3675376.1 CapA family protein [Paenibacillus ehimensis]